MVRLTPMLRRRSLGVTRKIMLFLVLIEAVIIVISGVATYGGYVSSKFYSEPTGDQPHVYLSIGLDDVQPSSGEALATVRVTVSVPHGRIPSPSDDSNVVAKFNNEESDAVLQFEKSPDVTSSDDLDAWTSKPARVRLTAYGEQSFFPIDGYQVIGNITLIGNGSFSIVDGPRARDAYPVYLGLGMGFSTTDWIMSRIEWATGGYEGSQTGVDSTTFKVIVSRPWAFSIYVLAVASLPLMIALAFFSKARAHQSSRTDSTSPLELASALLALLALRQVLTPTSVSSITLLDRILAAELALILLSTLFIYLEIDQRRTTMKPAALDGRNRRLPAASDFSQWAQSDSGLWVPPVPSSDEGGQHVVLPPLIGGRGSLDAFENTKAATTLQRASRRPVDRRDSD